MIFLKRKSIVPVIMIKSNFIAHAKKSILLFPFIFIRCYVVLWILCVVLTFTGVRTMSVNTLCSMGLSICISYIYFKVTSLWITTMNSNSETVKNSNSLYAAIVQWFIPKNTTGETYPRRRNWNSTHKLKTQSYHTSRSI
jgi:hypothetical protein